MIRKITAKAQNDDVKIEVSVKVETKNLMQREIANKIETVKNDLYDMLRIRFNHSEIKVS